MNIAFRSLGKARAFLGRLLSTSLLVCGLGAVAPAQAAGTAVAIDKSPLIIQPSLPPDVVLMLDDSGSMAWDVMPDWEYLSSTSADALVSSSVNGLYYNPSVSYTPPYQADGNQYPAASFDSAWIDGFNHSAGTVDLSDYDGSDDSSRVNHRGSNIQYSTTVNGNGYTPTKSCAAGDTQVNSGSHRGLCAHTTYTGIFSTTTYYNRCNQASDAYTYNQCTPSASFFTYTVKNADGTYTRHYVGAAGTCALVSLGASSCDDSATTRQSVANWYSYYHTRMLMAKSGVMNAFSSLDGSFRVGFGSIGGSNAGNGALGSDKYSFTTSSDGIRWGTGLSKVKPFDTLLSDGSGQTQRQRFWNWIAGTSPRSGTPLQQALDAVGQYYMTDQPWQTQASDPDYTAYANTELACRQAYTILTTDGFWNGDNPDGIADQDGTSGSTVTGPNGQSYAYTPALPYSDSSTTTTTTGGVANTLADVAMKYWKTDLRTSTANEVPTNTADPAFWQHMVTFTMGMGFTPTGIQPSGTTVEQIFDWADGGTAIDGFSWPTPSSNNVNNIADLAHAAVNGHGGFYSATSPQAFADGLKDALKRASSRVGTGASLAANSTQLQTGTVAYQANYYTAKWTGDLKAFDVNSATGAISTTSNWTAVTSLPAAANRNIWSYNPSHASDASGYTEFKVATDGTPPALSSTQLSALGGDATAQASMINYLRGDASKEVAKGGSYRTRETPLGDIVDSQPVYVGAPDPNQFYTESFTGSTSFAAYANSKASRTGLIYVAANDGMLHAFNATSGAEAYAYLPGAVITSGLKDLADPEYGGDVSHEFFNDGELTVADAYFGSAWHTILVGTTGKGLAKAVYALDVTDPANIQFLWERSAGDGLTNSNYIGQMTGKPVIAQTADGVWSVLMGNGYNSAAGKSALLQFSLQDGTLNVHATTDTTGLAAPAVWMDPSGNGISTVAYAGDASGNVWKFTLNTSTGSTDTATPSSNGVKLFTAKDSGNNAQPITAGLLIGRDSQTGNVWVFFGTGKYLASTDLTDTSTQTWYGLIVSSTDSADHPAVDGSSHSGRSTLASRSITSETAASGDTLGKRAVTTSANADSLTGKSGWYIDLLSPTGANGAAVKQGERMVTPNQFQGNLLLGTTRIPEAKDVCNPSGSGWIMAIDPFTGTNPQSNFFDTNGDGVIDSNDAVSGTPAAGVGFSSLPNNPIFVGGSMLVSFDNGTNSSIHTSSTSGGMRRVSWRELVNQ